MSFSSPLALWALLLVPAAAIGYVLLERRRVRESAQFVSPALRPNVVDRVPPWRRHLPVALLLLAVAVFLVGFARPHANVSVRSEEATKLMRSIGYPIIITQKMDITVAMHQCGTARFGTDPATSVLDPYCRVWDVDNLYVVDTSFFVSIGAVNPSLTAIANALRIGDHLRQRLG